MAPNLFSGKTYSSQIELTIRGMSFIQEIIIQNQTLNETFLQEKCDFSEKLSPGKLSENAIDKVAIIIKLDLNKVCTGKFRFHLLRSISDVVSGNFYHLSLFLWMKCFQKWSVLCKLVYFVLKTNFVSFFRLRFLYLKS